MYVHVWCFYVFMFSSATTNGDRKMYRESLYNDYVDSFYLLLIARSR